ncbi:hypothetical protein TNCV_1240021 [Trichonephila clavipes]|nr:hypothetical protein TNCV_1240021 [Trichonephila clavipes]
MQLCPPDSRTTCERNVSSNYIQQEVSLECLARAHVLRERAHGKGFPWNSYVFLAAKSLRSACLPFSRRRMRKMFPVFPSAMLMPVSLFL